MENCIYIVGPVTGVENWESAFKKIEQKIKKQSISYISPRNYPKGLTQEQYMQMSVANVFAATHIVLLDGWENSEGAKIEEQLARKIKRIVITQRYFLDWGII